MPSKMAINKKPLKTKQIKKELVAEMNFLKSIFSIVTVPLQRKGDGNEDFEMTNDSKDVGRELPKRAQSIAELEDKLQKIKSQTNFNLKKKLAKKSISSKLNKKIKKRDRAINNNKSRVKGELSDGVDGEEKIKESKPNVPSAKPIYNTEGKLVFSKFDFAKVGKGDKKPKEQRDPKKLLENIKQQEEKFQQLAVMGDGDKVKEMKEKMLWKNTLQKAEGQKIKDDPVLLKKSIKKQEQKKKVSQKKWDTRIKNVEMKKDDRQKKRKENIMKKKKEKKTKVVKAAAKRGRVVI